MSATDSEADRDRFVDEIVRVMGGSAPDEWTDCHPDETSRRVMGWDRDTGGDGAPMRVPAPHEPSPLDSAVALTLPVQDETH